MSDNKNKQPSREEAVKTLSEKIKNVRFAMLTTVASNGVLTSRPMTTQQIEFDGDLWFFVQADSGKVDDIKANPNVNVAYSKPDDNLYISMYGKASIVDDKAKEKEMWNPLYKAWFPDGLDDPNLALIKVEVEGAEYWDAAAPAVVQLLGFAKAVVTGQRFEGVGSDNETVSLA